ncbi:N-acetyltransferase 9-like protein [Convolutriloba macropyga]|uniref:N-acetyltransferase 9-like protein n=1 Tax=Convolutriloba macropyga TaxID=536237 RepID=UPI003F527F5F
MLLNEKVIVTGEIPRCWLVPYNLNHVEKYHSWMNNSELLELTASEPLTLDEEFSMQKSWRDDDDKLTFLVIDPDALCELFSRAACCCDTPSVIYLLCREKFELKLQSRIENNHNCCNWCKEESNCLIGDINLFIDWQELTGEINMMIAEECYRRRGYGKVVLQAFVYYIKQNLKLAKLLARIGDTNYASISFFMMLGFSEHSRSSVFQEITYEKDLADLILTGSNFEIYSF